jgi:looped-hinge helix DNA binding domain, AbrB family
MSKTEQSENSEKEVVTVTKHGQATIPKRFREKLGIDTPGKVVFREDRGRHGDR